MDDAVAGAVMGAVMGAVADAVAVVLVAIFVLTVSVAAIFVLINTKYFEQFNYQYLLRGLSTSSTIPKNMAGSRQAVATYYAQVKPRAHGGGIINEFKRFREALMGWSEITIAEYKELLQFRKQKTWSAADETKVVKIADGGGGGALRKLFGQNVPKFDKLVDKHDLKDISEPVTKTYFLTTLNNMLNLSDAEKTTAAEYEAYLTFLASSMPIIELGPCLKSAKESKQPPDKVLVKAANSYPPYSRHTDTDAIAEAKSGSHRSDAFTIYRRGCRAVKKCLHERFDQYILRARHREAKMMKEVADEKNAAGADYLPADDGMGVSHESTAAITSTATAASASTATATAATATATAATAAAITTTKIPP